MIDTMDKVQSMHPQTNIWNLHPEAFKVWSKVKEKLRERLFENIYWSIRQSNKKSDHEWHENDKNISNNFSFWDIIID
jgi:hypothetical protein